MKSQRHENKNSFSEIVSVIMTEFYNFFVFLKTPKVNVDETLYADYM